MDSDQWVVDKELSLCKGYCVMWSGSEEGFYLRLIYCCITQLCWLESNDEEEEALPRLLARARARRSTCRRSSARRTFVSVFGFRFSGFGSSSVRRTFISGFGLRFFIGT